MSVAPAILSLPVQGGRLTRRQRLRHTAGNSLGLTGGREN